VETGEPLVLRCPPGRELEAYRVARGRVRAVGALGVLVVVLVGGLVALAVGAGGAVPLPAAVFLFGVFPLLSLASVGAGLVTLVPQTRLARALRGAEVELSADGVAYVCAAGRFAVPWASVGRVTVVDRPRDLRGRDRSLLVVAAAGWDGPVGAAAGNGRTPRLRLPLRALTVDRTELSDAVRHLSGGRIDVTRVAA
jgi:hypothetical protein